jgi:hypothetical protein
MKKVITIIILLVVIVFTAGARNKIAKPEPETNWGNVTVIKPATYDDIDNFKTDKVVIRINRKTGLVERVTNFSIINWFDVYLVNMFSFKSEKEPVKQNKRKINNKQTITSPR